MIQLTALNPALTLPLVLLARYTVQGSQLASQHGTTFKTLKGLLALGALGVVSKWLDGKVMNNWQGNKKGEWDWNKEVVVVTGGSDGIGKLIVLLLAEKGIKVGVLDVQELTYEGEPTLSSQSQGNRRTNSTRSHQQHPHPSNSSNATSETRRASLRLQPP